MPININDLSAKELATLISKASQRKKKLAKRKPLALIKKKLTALAKAEGYSLAEIIGGVKTSRMPKEPKVKGKAVGKRAKVAAKYRNPAKSDETWSGRGKQPRWLAAEIAHGKHLSDFAIK